MLSLKNVKCEKMKKGKFEVKASLFLITFLVVMILPLRISGRTIYIEDNKSTQVYSEVTFKLRQSHYSYVIMKYLDSNWQPSKYNINTNITEEGYYRATCSDGMKITHKSYAIIDRTKPQYREISYTKYDSYYLISFRASDDTGISSFSIVDTRGYAIYYGSSDDIKALNNNNSVPYKIYRENTTRKFYIKITDKVGNTYQSDSYTVEALEGGEKTQNTPIPDPKPDPVPPSGGGDVTPPDRTKPNITYAKVDDAYAGSIQKDMVRLIARATDSGTGIMAYRWSTNPNLTYVAKDWAVYKNGTRSDTGEKSYEVKANGTYYFYAIDGNYNMRVSDPIVVNNIDKEGPEITYEATNTIAKYQTVKATIKDSKAGVYGYMFTQEGGIKADSTGWTLLDKSTKTISVEFKATSNGTWYLYAKDGLGNMSKKDIKIEKVDTTPPEINSILLNTVAETLKPLRIAVTASDQEDNLSEIQINKSTTPDDSKWTPITRTYGSTVTYVTVNENGLYYVHVRDKAGNMTSKSVEVTNIVDEIEDNTRTESIDTINDKHINEDFVPTTSKTTIRRVVLINNTTGVTEGYWLGKANSAGVIKDYDRNNDPSPYEENSTNKITAADARIALRVSQGLEKNKAIQAIAGDYDGNGTTEHDDAMNLLRIAANLEDALKNSKNREKFFPTITTEGEYELILTEYDGTTRKDPVSYNFTLDKSSPSVKIDIDIDNESNTLKFIGTASDSLTNIVAYQFSTGKADESKWTTISNPSKQTTQTYTTDEYLEDLFFYVKDEAGNVGNINLLNATWGGNETGDIMSPTITRFERDSYKESENDANKEVDEKSTDGLTTKLIASATDDIGIVAYQFSDKGNLNASSEGWKTVNSTKEFSQTIEGLDLTLEQEYYFYVKDATGNYSVRSLTGKNERDTQRPMIINVIGSGEEKVNSEKIEIEATDFKGGSGIVEVSVSSERGKYNWTKPQETNNGATNENKIYTTEITTNGNHYIYVRDSAGNISNAYSIQVSNITDKVNSGDIELAYNDPVRIYGTVDSQLSNDGSGEIKSVEYSTSNASVAKVDTEGNITGVAKGTATITATVRNYDDSTIAATCNVDVLDEEINIVEEPVSTEVMSANEINLKVETEEGTNIQYQWYKTNSESNTGGQAIAGATTNTYKVSGDEINNSNYYYVALSNNSDSLTTETTVKTSAVLAASYKEPQTPTISVVDKNNKNIESTQWATSDLTITLDSDTSGVGAGTIAYKYSYDNKNWTDYTGPIKYSTETNNTTIYAKSYNTENTDLESEVSRFIIKLDKTAPTVDSTTNASYDFKTGYPKEVIVTDQSVEPIKYAKAYEVTVNFSDNIKTKLLEYRWANTNDSTNSENGEWKQIAVKTGVTTLKINDVDEQKEYSGKYILLIRVTDEAGNVSEIARQPYYFDNDIDIPGKGSLVSEGKSIVQDEGEENLSYLANNTGSDIEVSLKTQGNDYNSGLNRTSYSVYEVVNSTREYILDDKDIEANYVLADYAILILGNYFGTTDLVASLNHNNYIDIQAVVKDQIEPVTIAKDGIYVVIVKTVDQLGNAEYVRYWVGRDTNASVETKSKITLQEQLDKYNNITGINITAKDSSGVKNVYYKWVLNNDDDAEKDKELKESNAAKIAENDYEGLNSDKWQELKKDKDGNYLAPTKNAGYEGECYLVIKVIDGLGNNDYYAQLFTIDGKVTNPSTLSLNLLDENGNYIKEGNNNKTAIPEANKILIINNKAEIDIKSGSDGKDKNSIYTTYTIEKDGKTSDEFSDAISERLTEDGLYTIKVKSQDSMENTTTITYKVRIDTTAPTIELSTNENVIGSSAQVTVTLNDGDGTGIDFSKTRYMWTRGYRPSDAEINNPDSIFSGNITSASTTLTSPDTGDSGVWCLWVLTYDKAGNMTRNKYSNITTDVSKPIAGTITAKTVSDDRNYTFKTNDEDESKKNVHTGDPVCSDINFTMKNGYDLESNVSSTEISCTREINEQILEYALEKNSDGSYTLTETGVYTITVTTTNKANPSLQSSNIYIIKIDKDAPIVRFDPNENETFAKQHTVKVTIEDGIAGVNTGKIKYYWQINGENTSEIKVEQTEFEVKTPEKATGDAILYVYSEDNCGNGEYRNSEVFNVDNTAPTKPIITATKSEVVGTQLTDVPYYGEITNKEVTLTASYAISLSGVDRYEFICTTNGGETWSEWTRCTKIEKDGEVFWQLKAVEEGTYIIKVRGISELIDGENIGIESDEFIVRIDKTAPTVEFANTDDGQNGSENWAQSKSVKVTIQDPSGVNTNVLKYAWVNVGSTSSSEVILNPLANGEPIVTPSNAQGEYKLYVYAEDNVGNATSNVYSNVYKIDTKVPETPTVTPNVEGSMVNRDVTLTVSGSSAVSGITYKYSTDNGATWNIVNNNNILLNKEGENKVIVKAISGSGVESAQTNYSVTIDKTAPAIQVSPNGGTYDKIANVTISIYDEISGLSSQNRYQYCLSTSKTVDENATWIDFVNGEQFTIGEGLQTGTYYLQIKPISDNAGNTTQTITSAAFTIRNEVQKEPEEGELYIKSDIYTVDRTNMYIMKISPNTKLEDFLKNITTSGLKDEQVIIRDVEDKTITDKSTIVCTGTNIEVKAGNNSIKYVLIVKGDVNGDGKANINDIFTINKYRLNKIQLNKIYLCAGDVNDDGVTGLDDILKLNKYRLNKINNL